MGRFLDTTIDTMKRALSKGDRITVTGFAIFSESTRQTRSGRNPKTEEQIKISASKEVTLEPRSAITASSHGTHDEQAGG
jgi:DNA-binding protein HU-beta